jgi:hypothetical protein
LNWYREIIISSWDTSNKSNYLRIHLNYLEVSCIHCLNDFRITIVKVNKFEIEFFEATCQQIEKMLLVFIVNAARRTSVTTRGLVIDRSGKA